MKTRLFLWAFVGSLILGFVLALMPRNAIGQGEYSNAGGAPYNAAVNALATNIYVASRGYDLQNFNAVAVEYSTGQAQAGQTNYVKNQWSKNGSNWFDEPVLVAGSVSGGEAPYVVNSRVVVMGASNANSRIYGERLNRLDRHFRVMTKTDAAASTSRVSVVFVPLNN